MRRGYREVCKESVQSVVMHHGGRGASCAEGGRPQDICAAAGGGRFC